MGEAGAVRPRVDRVGAAMALAPYTEEAADVRSFPCYTVDVTLSRRHLVLLPGLALLGCEKVERPLRGCATPIDDASQQQRRALAYVAETPNAGQRCDNCNKYVANQFQDCGGCLLFSGPVAPAGYCRSWAASPLKPATEAGP